MFLLILVLLFSSTWASEHIGIEENEDICQTREVHALILARKGSRGVPGKNLVKLDGLSLLARTIRTIESAEVHFAGIWVSTDSELIAQEAETAGARVYWRESAYAQDNSSSLSAVQEFLKKHPNIERVALFQCTSVFLQATYIEKAYRLFSCSDCVFTVTRSHKLRWRQIDHERLVADNFDANLRPRRQDWDGELYEAGMFYFSTRKLILQEQRFQNERCSVVEVSQKHALEIDTPEDLLQARCLLKTTIN